MSLQTQRLYIADWHGQENNLGVFSHPDGFFFLIIASIQSFSSSSLLPKYINHRRMIKYFTWMSRVAKSWYNYAALVLCKRAFYWQRSDLHWAHDSSSPMQTQMFRQYFWCKPLGWTTSLLLFIKKTVFGKICATRCNVSADTRADIQHYPACWI